jgi:hypothetical protein
MTRFYEFTLRNMRMNLWTLLAWGYWLLANHPQPDFWHFVGGLTVALIVIAACIVVMCDLARLLARCPR